METYQVWLDPYRMIFLRAKDLAHAGFMVAKAREKEWPRAKLGMKVEVFTQIPTKDSMV
jgi:hypothetical protein